MPVSYTADKQDNQLTRMETDDDGGGVYQIARAQATRHVIDDVTNH